MGGIMPDRSRDAAIERLRKAAQVLLGRRVAATLIVGEQRVATRHPYQVELEDAWRAFPECERDASTPSPEAVLAMCEAYDRQKAESDQLAAQVQK